MIILLVLKILSPHLIYQKQNVRLITMSLILFINYYNFVTFLAHENDVITNNDDIVNTPDTQIQEQKKHNNVSVLISDNIY